MVEVQRKMRFLIDLLRTIAVPHITIQKDGRGGKGRTGEIDGGSKSMKLIIDIPDWYYHEVHEFMHPNLVDKAIRDGIILPKGHGRLIDVDALYDSTKLCHTEEDGTACVEWREINDAPTIIEADKEE